MSQEILDKIIKAEAEAENIRCTAREKAETKIREAQEKGDAAVAEAKRRAARENADKLELIKSKAGELIRKTKADSELKAKAATISAEIKMREAVKLAVVSVLEECR